MRIFRSDFKAASIAVFAAMGLCAAALSGCKAKADNPNLTYDYSKDSPIFEFCESLRDSIENTSENIIEFSKRYQPNGLIETEMVPNLEKILSNLNVPFDYLKWDVVDSSERKNAFILTLPHQVSSYDRHGTVRAVSVLTVRKYIDQFETRAKDITYAKSKIDESGYVFMRALSWPNYKKTGIIPDQFSRDLTGLSSGKTFHSPIYVEFEGLEFDLGATAEMIVAFKDHVLFLDVYPGAPDVNGVYLWVRIFDQNLKPGENPFLFDHPWGQREASGPLRHVNDNGCSFIATE